MRVDPYQYQQSQMLWKSRCNWDSIFNVVPEFKKWCYEPIAWHQNWVRSRPTIFLPKWNGNLWKTEFFTPWPPARKRRDASGWVQQVKLLVRMGQQIPCWQKMAAGPFWPCFAYPKLGDAGRTRVDSKNRAVLWKASWPQNLPERIFLFRTSSQEDLAPKSKLRSGGFS